MRGDEEYFKDHFTGFPVLPGVLMLEGLTQSASWYIQSEEGFSSSQVYLSECSQAKYSRLVRPGAVLTFEAELVAANAPEYEFRGKVTENGQSVAAARFRMRSGKVGETDALFGRLEDRLNERNRRIFQRLTAQS